MILLVNYVILEGDSILNFGADSQNTLQYYNIYIYIYIPLRLRHTWAEPSDSNNIF